VIANVLFSMLELFVPALFLTLSYTLFLVLFLAFFYFILVYISLIHSTLDSLKIVYIDVFSPLFSVFGLLIYTDKSRKEL
jgi:hypothetical protein